jgi:hypothetical protein
MKLATVLVGLTAACGGSDSPSNQPDSAVEPDGPAGCVRMPASPERARFVVVSHPYDSAGMKAGAYEVLDLSPAAALTRPNRTFMMDRATMGTIAFTPDGEIGLVATEEGKLAVFRLDAQGMPTVVNAGFKGAFYASRVVVEPRGDRALVLDGNWRENGGGIYRVAIGCDGTLTELGMIAPAKLPAAIAFTNDHAVVAATDIMESNAAGYDVHLLGWGDAPTVLGGSDAFGDDAAIVAGAALTFDGATFLVGDNSQFSGMPNRVAAVKVSATGVAKGDVVEVEDPAAIAASPFGNVAIVASAFGDAIYILDVDNGAWRVRGQVTYMGASPKIPADVATIDRGTLRGHVLVAENVGVRHLAFRMSGAIDDLGSLAFGMGLENISGAIGVTP